MVFTEEFCRDNDNKLSFFETNNLFMSILKFFGDASCRVTIDGLIEGLRKLGEPREVTEAVRRYLVPILETLPRWEIINCHGEETQKQVLASGGFSSLWCKPPTPTRMERRR